MKAKSNVTRARKLHHPSPLELFTETQLEIFFRRFFETKQAPCPFFFIYLFYFITAHNARNIMKLPTVDNEFIFIGRDPRVCSEINIYRLWWWTPVKKKKMEILRTG